MYKLVKALLNDPGVFTISLKKMLKKPHHPSSGLITTNQTYGIDLQGKELNRIHLLAIKYDKLVGAGTHKILFG